VRRPVERGRGISEKLGAWFDANRRDLPWRRTRDPYAIWLSEVMLQQTRVKTVVEYFPRFLRSYPTVLALARADVAEVLGAWSGLGYYRRARALHAGAREVVEKYGGRLPREASRLREISGIGPYTAGAIASIAWDAREPLVDGNVARVLSRLFAVREDVRSSAGAREIWRLAAELVPEVRPGRHNEGLMELGATVCLPQEPRCDECPLSADCRARALGLTGSLPVAKKKKAPREVSMVAMVSSRGSRVLLGRRHERGLFAGLWEPPMVEVAEGAEPEALMGDLLGVSRVALSPVLEQTHVLTHRKLRIAVARGKIDRTEIEPRGPYDRFAWLTRSELRSRGMSSLARKVLAACALGVLVVLLGSRAARAQEQRRLKDLEATGTYVNVTGTGMVGDGLRFNNPYRLPHVLGKTAESLSTTAPYLDLALGATLGEPDGLQHGIRLGWSFALAGVPQHVVTPAYLAVLRTKTPWMLYAWAGLPLILQPDFGVGGELAVGGARFFSAGLAATASIVADAFYGAATRESRVTIYPVLSAQLGILVDYELLP
jgi:A/G-specific adenine glycosylase